MHANEPAPPMATIAITRSIAIDERDIEETFVRASGPGGQNVNKVETAVQLRFDVANAPALPDDVRERLSRLAGSRLTNDGVLIITSQRFRTQERNRADALEKLTTLIREATVAPKPRRATRPTLASKTRRLESKSRRGDVKKLRGGKPDD
jgi:ribosome-associated protein